MDILKSSQLQANALQWLWTQTTVDVTNTVHEAARMVLHDRNVTDEVRKKRGEALLALGELFQAAERPSNGEKIAEQEGYEEVAFHAMLDTIWRQEKASRAQYAAERDA